MPVTKRIAVHQGFKGMNNCINYVRNDDKTDNGKLISTLNLEDTTGQTAEIEFKKIDRMYNMDENFFDKNSKSRSCYHIIQSFDPRETISYQEVNRIGIELCKELYPNFQCLVVTHNDRGHMHNHIIVNSINLEGKKLDDRLSNEKEGIRGMMIYSDRISREHGCEYVLNDIPCLFGKHKKKFYDYNSKTNGSWKSIFKEKIDELKPKCNSFDELLELLYTEGYQITGVGTKHIKFKPYGKKKFTRFDSLGEGYTENDLKDYFNEKHSSEIEFEQLSDSDSYITTGEYQNLIKAIARNSRNSIIFSRNGMNTSSKYPRYRYSLKQEMQRLHDLSTILKFITDEGINNYETLVEVANHNEDEIKTLTNVYNKNKEHFSSSTKTNILCEAYLLGYNQFRNYLEEVKYRTYELNKKYSNTDFTGEIRLYISEDTYILISDEKPSQEELRDSISKYLEYKVVNDSGVTTTLVSKDEDGRELYEYIDLDGTKKQFWKDEYTMDEELEAFESVSEQLFGFEDNKTIEEHHTEVADMTSEYNKEKRSLFHEISKIDYLKSKQTAFEKLKSQSLLDNQFIKGMSFSKNMIDEKRTDDKYYCVKVPYTNKYVYLNKENVCWSVYDVRFNMYLREDDTFKLYDADNHVVDEVDGEELDRISKDEKEKISNYYKK